MDRRWKFPHPLRCGVIVWYKNSLVSFFPAENSLWYCLWFLCMGQSCYQFRHPQFIYSETISWISPYPRAKNPFHPLLFPGQGAVDHWGEPMTHLLLLPCHFSRAILNCRVHIISQRNTSVTTIVPQWTTPTVWQVNTGFGLFYSIYHCLMYCT